jgi:anaerobic selenocysteine-containing dehydrogenase
MDPKQAQHHYRVCNLCEAMCGLEIKHDGKKVLSIKPDKEDPFSLGHICPKGTALQDIYNDPDRLKMPVKKTADGWQEISWQQAFDEIEYELTNIMSRYGSDAVAMYLGNPTVHSYGALFFIDKLIKALKTRNLFSATSVDQLPHHFASNFMFGHSLMIPVPDINRTDYMLVLGANPVASNGSLMSAAGMPKRLKNIQARGGKVIVIDPRLTETAELADEHHFIRPGTDVFLLLSMLHVIFDKQLIKLNHLELHSKGLDKIRNAVSEYSPQKVRPITGMWALTIERLAVEFATSKRSICYGRMGLSTQAHGGLCQWLIIVLNIVTGHFDTEGGAMFPTPAVDLLRDKKSMGKVGRWTSRVRALPEFKGELPVSVMAEEMLVAGKGQVKALITHAGNPVLSTPNGKKLEQALPILDYMVAIDIYINETTRHANIILPPATGLEVDHYDLVFNSLAVSNNAKFSPALFKPAPGAMYDWQILKELSKRISGKTSFADRLVTPTRLLDLALRFGPYGSFRKWSNLFKGLSLKKLKSHEHGIDLGPLQSRIPEILQTPDKKVDLAPEVFMNRLQQVGSEIDTFEEPSINKQFMLIGRRHVRSNNSWMHNSHRLIKGKNRCTLIMHEDDAGQLGLSDNQEVRVSSRVGEISILIEITKNIMPGVVSMPHGYGHNRKDSRIHVAEANAGVSINDITDEQQVDELTGNAAFSGQLVSVEPLGSIEI